jgi:hypothetical protein
VPENLSNCGVAVQVSCPPTCALALLGIAQTLGNIGIILAPPGRCSTPRYTPTETSAMHSIQHLQSLTLDLPPSCIEFWPANEKYAVVGTYNLDTANDGSQPISQRRNGSLILLHVNGEEVYVLQPNFQLKSRGIADQIQ